MVSASCSAGKGEQNLPAAVKLKTGSSFDELELDRDWPPPHPSPRASVPCLQLGRVLEHNAQVPCCRDMRSGWHAAQEQSGGQR